MKIVQINATCGRGSTGKICVSISKLLCEKEIENYILYCSGDTDYPLGIKCADEKYIKMQALKAHLTGNWGFNSEKSTEKMIHELKRIDPDIVHLHNIHGHDCNLEMLFKFFKERKQKLFWTFHDCWAFTGYCMHFTMAKCDKWKTACTDCPQRRKYSLFFDKSSWLYRKKRELFDGLDLTVITPSRWLAELVRQSVFADYPVKVINNGIDLQIFKPTQSDFRSKYKLEKKHIVLGVAFGWGAQKGLDVFVNLSKRLDDTYKIVLVGTNDAVDSQLPSDIISIHRTNDQSELAEIYTAADVFVNPTREEVFGMVNIEALACGTPVVTFKTGGSPETIDETCGRVVPCDDVDELEKSIIDICENALFTEKNCVLKSKNFGADRCFCDYVDLYEVRM